MSPGAWAVVVGLPAVVIGAVRGDPVAALVAWPGSYLLGRTLGPRVGRAPALAAVALVTYGTTVYVGLCTQPRPVVGVGVSLGAAALALALEPGVAGRRRLLLIGLLAGAAARLAPPQAGLLALAWAPERDRRPLGRLAPWTGFAAGMLLPLPIGVPGWGWPEPGVTLFGSVGGLLFRSPVAWLGVVGLLLFPRTRPGAAGLGALAVGAGIDSALRASGDPLAGGRLAALAPVLALGVARAARSLRDAARARPLRAWAAPAVVLVVWNFAFMAVYRRFEIPRDGTVAFVDVVEANARAVWQVAGAPLAWPANWLLAARLDVPPGRWDTLAERRLFDPPESLTATLDVGADVPLEEGLLGEGWSVRHLCGDEACRDVVGRARLFLPLPAPADVDVELRLRGSGLLRLQAGGSDPVLVPLPPTLTDVGLVVAARHWRRGLNPVTLELVGDARAQLARVELRRRP